MNTAHNITTTLAPLTMRISASVISDYALTDSLPSLEATRRAHELEKFLSLAASGGFAVVPSPAIDAIWHEFILHTHEYADFCTTNFGRFIHHRPSRTWSPRLREGYLQTIDALSARFGAVPDDLWPHSEAYLQEVCNTGDCRNCDRD